VYARYLAEVGFMEEALKYCDVISAELGKMGKPEFALMGRAGKTIKKDIEELSNRLKICLNKKSVGAAVSGIAQTIGSYFFSGEKKKPEKIVCEKAWLPQAAGTNGPDESSQRGKQTRQARKASTRQVNKSDPTRPKRGVRINDKPSAAPPMDPNSRANRGRRASFQSEDLPSENSEPARRTRGATGRRPKERRPRPDLSQKADPTKERTQPQRTRFDPSVQETRRRPLPRAKKTSDVPRVSSDGALVKESSQELIPRSRSRPVMSPRAKVESETEKENDVGPDFAKERSRHEDTLSPRARHPVKRKEVDEKRRPAPRSRPRPAGRTRVQAPAKDDEKVVPRVSSRSRLQRGRPTRATLEEPVEDEKSEQPKGAIPGSDEALSQQEEIVEPMKRVSSRSRMPSARARPVPRAQNEETPSQKDEIIEPPMQRANSRSNRARPPRARRNEETQPPEENVSEEPMKRVSSRSRMSGARARPVPRAQNEETPSQKDEIVEPPMKRANSRSNRARPPRARRNEEAQPPEENISEPIPRVNSRSRMPPTQSDVSEPQMQRVNSRSRMYRKNQFHV